jgi:hypothetical protein
MDPRAGLPTPRDHHGIGVIGEKLYAAAGRIDGNHDRGIGVNEEHDAKLDRSRKLAPIPSVRSGVGASVLNGRVLVFRGKYRRATWNYVESYDPTINHWRG